jgi:hypothetical protein
VPFTRIEAKGRTAPFSSVTVPAMRPAKTIGKYNRVNKKIKSFFIYLTELIKPENQL